MNIHLTFCREVGGKKQTGGIIALLIKRLSSGVLFTPAGIFYAFFYQSRPIEDEAKQTFEAI